LRLGVFGLAIVGKVVSFQSMFLTTTYIYVYACKWTKFMMCDGCNEHIHVCMYTDISSFATLGGY
jgi:hypothetical protein